MRVPSRFATSWFGDLVMFGSVACLWYHTLAGVRHLIWDSGHMLDVSDALSGRVRRSFLCRFADYFHRHHYCRGLQAYSIFI
jgi:succinate dehydrogenase/fumarate reductase cytochrome b subunit